MNTKQIFWGIIFLVVGGLLLLHNFNVIILGWHFIWRFWPLVLILWGISLLIKDKGTKSVFYILIPLLIGLLIFSGIIGLIRGCNVDFDDVEITKQEIVEPYSPTVTNAAFQLEAGAGRFTVSDPTENLLTADIKSSFGEYKFDSWSDDSIKNLRISMTGPKIRFGSFLKGNQVRVHLNPNPIWKFDIDVGAADMKLDLTSYKTEKVKVDMGAASLYLKLGDLSDSTEVEIEGGASSVKIFVPESSGCEILTDVALSKKRFEGFEKSDEDIYRTSNYDSAGKKIRIKLNGGVSSIHVSRY